ncbi:uncharacterized protein LOC104898092 [Beta vulgaris subsp. vulgaris]|uniref:uncharacterized protein LOC104898092 n=1 Tax=Beta vulgaris subsp. vulgaris TaxID=3555 RepID=UPI00203681A8|nr:uncharacterized protein LOC104898092 [Beta vulgaris subsp. vulgaris]
MHAHSDGAGALEPLVSHTQSSNCRSSFQILDRNSMGRGKTAKNFIEKVKNRNLAYNQKKKTLFKKAREFSILCNVPICIIMFPFTETNKPSPPPEVISFKPNSNDSDQASNPDRAREIIDRYMEVTKEVKSKKRSLSLSDIYEDQELLDDHDSSSIKFKNPDLSEFNDEQLHEMLGSLDDKLDYVKRKIAMLKGVVVPTFVVPSNQSSGQTDQVMMNEFGPFDYGYSMFDDQIMTPIADYGYSMFNDQIMTPMTDDYYGGCSSNFVDYNLNMMSSTPMYYDQGQQNPVFSDAMPSQYFPMMPEISNFYY